MHRTLLALAVSLGATIGTIADAAAQTPPNGSVLFRQRCQTCHSLNGTGGAIGPNLTGVVGRKAAATPYNYSPAMRKSGLTWTPAVLDDYLTSPMKKVPGGRMPIGVSDPAQRAAIIAFLAGTK